MQCPPLGCCYFPSLSYSLPFSPLTLLCHLTHLILHVLYKGSLPFGYGDSALGSQDNIIILRPTLRAAKSRSLTHSYAVRVTLFRMHVISREQKSRVRSRNPSRNPEISREILKSQEISREIPKSQEISREISKSQLKFGNLWKSSEISKSGPLVFFKNYHVIFLHRAYEAIYFSAGASFCAPDSHGQYWLYGQWLVCICMQYDH